MRYIKTKGKRRLSLTLAEGGRNRLPLWGNSGGVEREREAKQDKINRNHVHIILSGHV